MISRYFFTFTTLTFSFLWASVSHGQTFVVGDSVVPVTNPVGFTDGDSIFFQGAIAVSGAGESAVTIDPVPTGITLTFQAGSVTRATGIRAGGDADGVGIRAAFVGTFNSLGTIISLNDDGVDFDFPFTGVYLNSGTITAGDSGLNFGGNMTGSVTNLGAITGGGAGVDFDANLSGTFTNRGTIMGTGDDGVEINRMTGTFNNFGSITSMAGSGVDVQNNLAGTFNNFGFIESDGSFGVSMDNLRGPFNNFGTIRGLGGVGMDNLQSAGVLTNNGTIFGVFDGVYINSNLRGILMNSGSISSGVNGIHIGSNLRGNLTNSGTISGERFGIVIDDFFEGTITNTGIIVGTMQAGVLASRSNGVLRNHGGRIQGGNNAIRLNANIGTVILSGPSHLVGNVNGGSGNGDVLRFENMRGITDAKKAELAALAIADSTALTTITLFGETLSWSKFEDIQADLATLQSYQSLITGPGLSSFATSLDNVQGLNDSFRDFLRGLNDVDAGLLNETASNISGQTLIEGMDDFARGQDQRVFSLFSNHFSSLRGGVSGRNNDGIVRSGLFTREVQAGAAVRVPDDGVTTFVTGYFGNSNQSATGNRPQSSADNSSILFGQGKNLTDELYFGFFGGYTNNQNTFDRFGSLLQNEVGYVGIDAQFQSGDWFANLVAAYGYHDQKSIRRDFLGNRMQGDTEGNQGLLYSQMGHDFYVGEEKQARVTPYLGFSLSSLSMRSFTENGPAATSLRFADQSISSFQSVIGINVSGYKEVSNGWLKPKIDAAWWHSYDGAQGANVSLASPGLLNGFGIIAPIANEDQGVFQIGVEAGFAGLEKWTFQANYFGTAGSDGYSSHGGSLSAKVKF